MDKKKLIGTIIGVVAFAALIAGATFAWLTINPNIVNGNVTGKTTNFIVDYADGTDVSNVPILMTSELATNKFTTATGGKITVKAHRLATDADGDLSLKLITTSSNAIVNASNPVLKYAVCVGTCTLTGTAQTSVVASTTGLLAKGNITTTDQILVTIDGIPTAETSYDIYLWLDSDELFGARSANYLSQTYAGYVSATAQQD